MEPGMKKLAAYSLVFICALSPPMVSRTHAPAPASSIPDHFTFLPPGRDAYLHYANEVDTVLRRDILDIWFPRTIDKEHGGFYSDFTRDWQRSKSHGKFSVFQGRMTWIASQVVIRRPDLRDQFLPYVKHGVNYLQNVLWDKKYGGFFLGLDDEGKISPEFTEGKHLYGMSFAIYGVAAAYQATRDPAALALSQAAFRWIDKHAHDPVNQGYFETLHRDGTPYQVEPYDPIIHDSMLGGFPIGYKSMNTHIHLLESFTQLYEVWPDDTLRQRVEELLHVVRDKVAVRPGVMNLYFTNEWRAVPDEDSYGHDVETTYLMRETADVLGGKSDQETDRVGRMLADHSYTYGWDDAHGGLYESGPFAGKPADLDKEWWVQMESLNTLLLLHEKYGSQTDAYWRRFQQQWQYIQRYQVDSQYHGIYNIIRPDGTPATTAKGSIWKAAYHDGRALLNVSERLQRLANASDNK
jgi:mannobiose 2-epimerase